MRHNLLALAFILTATFLVTTCRAQAGANSTASCPMITGTVAYRVRMALLPEAAIDVLLEDVSRADAPATLVAENIFAAEGKQVPIGFQLPYNPAEIQASHRYQVRARITVGGQLVLTTTQAYPVITHGAPTHVDLMLQPVGGPPKASQPHAGNGTAGGAQTASLRGTQWWLTNLNGQPSTSPMGTNAAQISLDATENRFSGSTGCNRTSGSFESTGESLKFKPGATTMMACPEPLMTQEQAFTAALQSVTSYRITDGTLELLAGDKVVARFKARKSEPAKSRGPRNSPDS